MIILGKEELINTQPQEETKYFDCKAFISLMEQVLYFPRTDCVAAVLHLWETVMSCKCNFFYLHL